MKLHIPRYGTHDEVLGLPARAMVLSNSERMTMACPLKWLFRYADGLQGGRSVALDFGVAAHACVEDVHKWWMEHDSPYPPGGGYVCVWPHRSEEPCPHCRDTGMGPIALTAKAWESFEDQEKVAKDLIRLKRMFDGWLVRWGRESPEEYRVVAPELKMALPVLRPDGRVYTTRVWVVPDAAGWRIARTGEASLPGAKQVRWPWYQCLTMDALLQDRQTGDLFVYEMKTARSPEGRLQAVSIDPQMAGYVHALRHAVAHGLIPGVRTDARVVGYLYDVLSNGMQNDPDLLKPTKVKARGVDGEPYKKGRLWVYQQDVDGNFVMEQPLSRNTRAGVPSWRFRAAIQKHGLQEDDYQDHLLELMSTVDSRLYVRDWTTSGPDVGARYARELYAVAQKLASWRRKSAELETQEQREIAFPRQPVCIGGYGCAYRAPCLQDGPMIRAEYDSAECVRWDDETKPRPQEVLGW